jgi:hypothetical protein
MRIRKASLLHRRAGQKPGSGCNTLTRWRRRTTRHGCARSTRQEQQGWRATMILPPGPVPEMADDSTYYPDVIRWLIAHPEPATAGFLVKASEHPDAAETARLKQTSCDLKTSVVCARAWAQGYRLSRDFYEGDRAMRESGFDPSFRFGPFDGATHHYAPVCLNSLLYRYEKDLEHFAHLLAIPADAVRWNHRAKARDVEMQRYLWRPKDGVFADYDFVHAKSSTLCLHKFAVSAVGGRGDAGGSDKDGCQAESV